MRRLTRLFSSMTMTTTLAAVAAAAPAQAQKIRIVVDGHPVVATLADNPTARDFASMLPLTLTLGDYANTEKIAYLDRKLATDAAPAGSTPVAGTIAYYAPWGNLAFFYRDFKYSPGLIPLGRVEAGLATLERAGGGKVRIELVR